MAKSLPRTDREIAGIYGRHVRTVYRVCYPLMHNPADTEDAVSETFLRMIRSAPAFESGEHEKAWLIRTAVNVCKDVLKSRRRREISLGDFTEVLKTEDGAETQDLLEAVCSLPERHRTAVHLYYYEGYSGAEIANILKRPRSTILNHLSEARAMLRKRLGGEFDEK